MKLSQWTTVIPTLRLTETCQSNAEGAVERKLICPTTGNTVIYHYRNVGADANENDTSVIVKNGFNQFPVVFRADGSPWPHASLYLLSRMRGVQKIKTRTCKSIASSLGMFRRFIEEKNIDYLADVENWMERPTYRFHAYMNSAADNKEIAGKTADRVMKHVISFYRWLQEEELIGTKNPRWQERERSVLVNNEQGRAMLVNVKSTNLKINSKKQKELSSETIDDGGKLRPLPSTEQEWLFDALAHTKNTELKLFHKIALSSGARIQTILTLRVHHFSQQLAVGTKDVEIAVGLGTDVDTKFGKNFSIYIPNWLYQALHIYCHSKRALIRRSRASGDVLANPYLFLTTRGNPYYSESDGSKFDDQNELAYDRIGEGIRGSIRTEIISFIRNKYSKNFHYRPHDLRATFGMNRWRSFTVLIEQGKMTLDQALASLSALLAHDTLETTMLYAKYDQNLEAVANASIKWEEYMTGLAAT